MGEAKRRRKLDPSYGKSVAVLDVSEQMDLYRGAIIATEKDIADFARGNFDWCIGSTFIRSLFAAVAYEGHQKVGDGFVMAVPAQSGITLSLFYKYLPLFEIAHTSSMQLEEIKSYDPINAYLLVCVQTDPHVASEVIEIQTPKKVAEYYSDVEQAYPPDRISDFWVLDYA